MNIESISNQPVSFLQEVVSVNMLKKNMDFQEEAALQLLQSLPQIEDPALGNKIDTYA